MAPISTRGAIDLGEHRHGRARSSPSDQRAAAGQDERAASVGSTRGCGPARCAAAGAGAARPSRQRGLVGARGRAEQRKVAVERGHVISSTPCPLPARGRRSNTGVPSSRHNSTGARLGAAPTLCGHERTRRLRTPAWATWRWWSPRSASAARSSSSRTPSRLVEPIPFLAVRFLDRRAPPSPRSPAGDRGRRARCATASLAGMALLVGYVLQTVGLQYTGSATSAFITYLLVVFVPMLGLRGPPPSAPPGHARRHRDRGRRPGAAHRSRAGAATRRVRPGRAPHPRVRGRLRRARRDPRRTAHRHDPIRLATVQVAFVGRGLRAARASGSAATGSRRPALAAAVATALVATALAFVLQVTGQRTVPPARARPAPPARARVRGGRGHRAGRRRSPPSQLAGAALILVAVSDLRGRPRAT